MRFVRFVGRAMVAALAVHQYLSFVGLVYSACCVIVACLIYKGYGHKALDLVLIGSMMSFWFSAIQYLKLVRTVRSGYEHSDGTLEPREYIGSLGPTEALTLIFAFAGAILNLRVAIECGVLWVLALRTWRISFDLIADVGAPGPRSTWLRSLCR